MRTTTILNPRFRATGRAARAGIFQPAGHAPPGRRNIARMGRVQQYWLMKSEPGECSIDDALCAKDSTVPWTGVRHYQARNFLRDQVRLGDGVLFYHSSCALPGIAGIAQIASGAYPDPTQFDRASPYFDPASRPENPRWILVDVRALRKTRLLPLAEMRSHKELAQMLILRRGNRLSITPVTSAQWRFITGRLLPVTPAGAAAR